MANRLGLPREIPDPVKRAVRQRDGYGCIICGGAIIDYHHVEPQYADASEHNPDRITLLCPNHHRNAGTFLGNDTIAAAMKSPKCKQLGFSFGEFYLGSEHLDVLIGRATIRRAFRVLTIYGDNVVWIEPPEEELGPFRISADIRDQSGQAILSLDRNHWRTPIENWDVEVVLPRIIIRQRKGKIALKLRAELPKRLTFEEFNILHRGVELSANIGRDIVVNAPTNGFSISEIEIAGFNEGLVVHSGGTIIGVDGSGFIRIRNASANFGHLEPSVNTGEDRPLANLKGNTESTSELISSLPRNWPCFCRSGLRLKNCHGRMK